jgi:hypothetical protein
MPLFSNPDTITTDVFDHFRREAYDLGCKMSFQRNTKLAFLMNDRGSSETGKFGCPWHKLEDGTYKPCPCPEVKEQIEKNGCCEKRIFVRK